MSRCTYIVGAHFKGELDRQRGKVANPIILTEAESSVKEIQKMKIGGALKMSSVHPVHVCLFPITI